MYLLRANESYIFQSFERNLISALLGPRRVGKTTLVDYYRQFNPDRQCAAFNMDKRSERLRIANDELKLMIEEATLSKIGDKKIWVMIDEAQKCPELFDQIKIIYDTYKDSNKIKFILTGSARLDLHQLTAESLAGRVDLLNLREFNLREIARMQHSDVTIPKETAFNVLFNDDNTLTLETLFEQLRPFNKIFREALETHLIWGGLPEVLQEPDFSYRLKYLADYLQTYLEKDIRAIDSISDIHLYHNLMKICAEQTGSLRDDKKIIEALGCSRNTLQKYRTYLQATLQYSDIYPYINSTAKRLVKSPKGYMSNNGLVSYLTNIHNLSILKMTGLLGHRFENWFLHELCTWQDTLAEQHHIYYWRAASGVEVDFIASCGMQVIPFEITYSTQADNRKINHLISFMKSEPKAKIGVYIYNGSFVKDKKNNIVFLPFWMV